MPYDPFERDDLRGRRRREPEAKKGKRLVLGGLLLMMAPLMILFFVTAGARVSYTDEKGKLHAPLLNSKEQRDATLKDPPPGSVHRFAEPREPVDYLVYVFVAIGIVVLLCGLFKMTPGRRSQLLAPVNVLALGCIQSIPGHKPSTGSSVNSGVAKSLVVNGRQSSATSHLAK